MEISLTLHQLAQQCANTPPTRHLTSIDIFHRQLLGSRAFEQRAKWAR
jgi:hypothetical protein